MSTFVYNMSVRYGNFYSWSHDSLRLIWTAQDVIQIGRLQKRQYDSLLRRDVVVKRTRMKENE
jgi:hypothetical protein